MSQRGPQESKARFTGTVRGQILVNVGIFLAYSLPLSLLLSEPMAAFLGVIGMTGALGTHGVVAFLIFWNRRTAATALGLATVTLLMLTWCTIITYWWGWGWWR